MSKWIRFKLRDGGEIVVPVVEGRKHSDEVWVYAEHNTKSALRVHSDDADLVWSELVAMCGYHSGDVNKKVEADRCEHGAKDGDWCEPCNREQKRARRAEGYDDDAPPKAETAPPLTYTRRTLDDGDTEIVLRSFTHSRGEFYRFMKTSVGIASNRCPSWSSDNQVLRIQGVSEQNDFDPILIPAADWPCALEALVELGAQEVGA